MRLYITLTIIVIIMVCITLVSRVEHFYAGVCTQRLNANLARSDLDANCEPVLDSSIVQRTGFVYKCNGKPYETTNWHPWWMLDRYRITSEFDTLVTDTKIYTSDYQHIPTPIFDDAYTGGFLKYNDTLSPGTGASTRDNATQTFISNKCDAAKGKQGVSSYDESIWRHRVGWWVYDPATKKNGMTGVGFNQEANVSATEYRGPCLWCAKFDGYWIPETVPLPYDGSRGKLPSVLDNLIGCPASFNDRFVQVTVNLPKRGRFNHVCNDASCVGYTGSQEMTSAYVKYDVSENGGIQLAWMEWHRYKGILHVTYMDNNFKRVAPDIIVEAVDIGGIVAFNDGTVLLVMQKDCDGPTTADGSSGMFKAVLIYWKNGKLQWATRITDPWVTGANGGGDYLTIYTHAKYTHLKYDPVHQLLYCNVHTSGGRGGLEPGGGHVGGACCTVNMSGSIVSKTTCCSHPQGDRYVVRNGVKANVCADDGWGIQPGLQQEIGIAEWPDFLAGQCPVRLGSIVPKDTKNTGYFLAYLRKSAMKVGVDWADLYKIFFLDLSNGNPNGPSASLQNTSGKRIPYFNTSKYEGSEIGNLHLLTYGEGFLLHFTSFPCNSFRTQKQCKPTENYQQIKWNGSTFIPISDVVQNEYRIYHSDDPYMYPTGDYMWATLEDITIIPYQWSTRPTNIGRLDNTTSTAVTFTFLRNC